MASPAPFQWPAFVLCRCPIAEPILFSGNAFAAAH